MKGGSLVLSLVLITSLLISGCEIQRDRIVDCMTNYSEFCSRFDLNDDSFVNILDFVIATSDTPSDFFGQDRKGRGVTMTIQSISSTSGAGTLEIYATSTDDLYGFQFSLDNQDQTIGVNISGASGGIAAASGYNFATGCQGECITAFNFNGNPILSTSFPGVLVGISYNDHYGGDVCFKEGEGAMGPYNIISGQFGVEITDVAWIDGCSGEIVYGCMDELACNYEEGATGDDGSCEYPDENYDCDGNCILYDECGVCGGDGTSCVGCMISDACNYDDSATIPCTSLLTTPVQEEPKEESSFWHRIIVWFMQFKVDENIQRSDISIGETIDDIRENECCEYPENYPDNIIDCDGNCIVDTDCAGTCNGDAVEDCNGDCGGSAVLDECGVCEGDSTSCCDSLCYDGSAPTAGVCVFDGSSCTGTVTCPNEYGISEVVDCNPCRGGGLLLDVNGDSILNVLDQVQQISGVSPSGTGIQTGSPQANMWIGGVSIVETGYPNYHGTIQIIMTNEVPVTGFQFLLSDATIDDLTITNIRGGSSETNGLTVSFDSLMAKGVSCSGNTIPPGTSNLLTLIDYSGEHTGTDSVCFVHPSAYNVISNEEGEDISNPADYAGCVVLGFGGCFNRWMEPYPMLEECPKPDMVWQWNSGQSNAGEGIWGECVYPCSYFDNQDLCVQQDDCVWLFNSCMESSEVDD